MVLINYAGRELNAKIVYYGPGLSGKTTNLECIYASVPTNSRGKMVSMKTRQDRTLFFDFLPLELGEVHGFRTRFLLYTVPGQVFYNATRKLVLKGADAVVFVADSGIGKMEGNLESLRNLEENLREQGLALETLPFVIQYNKRDLPQVHTVEELAAALNPRGVPSFEAAAATGQGVYETLHAVSRLLFQRLMQDLRPSTARPSAPSAAPSAPAPRPSPSPPLVPAQARTPAPMAAGGPPRGPGVPAATPAMSGTASGIVPHLAAGRPAPPELVEPVRWQGLPGPESLPAATASEGQVPPAPVPAASNEVQRGDETLRSQLFGTPASGHVPQPPTQAQILDSVHASARSLAGGGAASPLGEHAGYGHVVDLSVERAEPAGEALEGFIKDPMRRTEKGGAPGRGTAPSATPVRTQHVSIVVSPSELKEGNTIRVILDLKVEP